MLSTGVVVATYNGEKYIEEQLESICKQTYLPDCIVITDGGSSDRTVEKCKEISKKYKDIVWKILQSEKRLNVTENFEKGMENCESEIVFLCDQDDYWYNNKIEEYIKVFDSHPECIVVISDADVVNAELKKSGKTQWELLGFYPNKDVLEKRTVISEMLHRNIFTGMCMAYRSGFFVYKDIKSDFMLHDEAIGWFSIFNGNVGVINKRLASYRQHGNNVVGSKKYSKFQSISNFKLLVKKSTIRTMNKFQDIVQRYREKEGIIQIEKTLDFYKTRAELLDMSKIKAILQYFRLNKSYNKYTSRTEHAKIKDLAVILL